MLITGQPIMVIAVMGVTGAGKSTFVRAASGNDEVVVGHSLEACELAYPRTMILVKTNTFLTWASNTQAPGRSPL